MKKCEYDNKKECNGELDCSNECFNEVKISVEELEN